VFSISKKHAIKDYERLKEAAFKACALRQYSKSLQLIACAAGQAYHLNFRYADDALEGLLEKISTEVLGQSLELPQEEKYLLYDSFGYDNRGLTQQYLHALDTMGVQYLYLVESREFNVNGNIAAQVARNPKAQIIQVPSELGEVERLDYLFAAVKEYNPKKAFLHLAPWSTVAVTLWNAFPKVERYLIDLTDHAFWLGKSCSDYFIGFREYGYSVSVRERGIPREKLLNLPYYPIVASKPFAGFPEEAKGRVILFSGGAYYKIYGENDAYFKLVERIVNENPEVAILFAGSGNEKPFKNFIAKNGLQRNIFLIGNRTDINEVFRNCDIYMNSYPVIGGLMSQYAVLNKKPLIGYSTSDIPCNFSEGLFSADLHYKTTYTDIDEFHAELNKLICCKARREYASNYAPDVLPTPDSFAVALKQLVEDRHPVSFSDFDVHASRFSEVYFAMENNYLHKYHAIKFRHLGFRSFLYFPFSSIVSLLSVLRYNLDYINKFIGRV
jgi:hypothetical protein